MYQPAKTFQTGSKLLLSTQWVGFPFDGVQFQVLLHTMELLLKLELVQLLLRLVQLLRAWLCGETGATGCLLPLLYTRRALLLVIVCCPSPEPGPNWRTAMCSPSFE